MAIMRSDSQSPLGGIVIGLLSSFGSAFLIACIFLVVYVLRYTVPGRILLDRIGRPGEYDDEQAFAREEAEALETMDDMQRTEYLRAKGTTLVVAVRRSACASFMSAGTDSLTAFVNANPPESIQTDISLSQYLAIQEKGVSAWEFEPELEIANCFVEGRTEIEFFDSECTVMSNLPVPKQNEAYYWEAKVYEKPESTLLSIGMATKPYPLFRLPGKTGVRRAHARNTDRRQASTSTLWPTCPMAPVASTSPSTPPHMHHRSSKAMSSVSAIALELARFSTPGTARSWKTWYMA